MLKRFVQEVGHDYKILLEEVINDSSNKERVGLAALEAANDSIKVFVKGEDGLLYEHSSGSKNKEKSESD